MKKLFTLLGLIVITLGLQAQSGVSTFKYELRVPSLRVGGATKVKLDSIVQNVDTIKFYNGGTELKSNGAGIWTGTGIRLDTTLARITLGIDQVPNLSLAAMHNAPIFTSFTTIQDGIIPSVSGNGYLGSVTNQWASIYFREGSTINWANGAAMLSGGTGGLTLTGGDLNLHYNDLITYGNVGSLAIPVNYAYVDTLVANYANITLDGYAPITSPTFQTTIYVPSIRATDSATVNIGSVSSPFANLYLSGNGYIGFGSTGAIQMSPTGALIHSPNIQFTGTLDSPRLINDVMVRSYIIPETEGVATLGHSSYGWGGIWLDTLAAINWANTGARLTGAGTALFLENTPLYIDNNDLGSTAYRVNNGYFTDINVTNRPTIGTATAATTQDINDSLDYYISEASLGVALADSNVYDGGYTTRAYVEGLLGSGSGLSAERLPFIIGVTTGAPSASDSIIIHSAFDGKHIDLYRDGAKQYQQFTATNIYEGFRVSDDTIIVNPAWQANEQVLVDIIEPILWSYLSLEGQESSLLDSLVGYWALDESSGTTVIDATGTQNGTTNATVASGKIGYGKYIDGIYDAVSIAHNDAIIPKGVDFSVSMWFYLDSLPSTVAGLEGYYLFNQLNTESPWEPHNVQMKNYNDLVAFSSRNTSETAYSVHNGAIISDSTWHHMVIVNRGNGQTLQLYIDGVDVSTDAGTFTGTLFEGGSNTYFGHSYNGATQFTRGRIDECGMWRKALSTGEVAALWNSGNGRTYPFN